jgi:spermidine synthase
VWQVATWGNLSWALLSRSPMELDFVGLAQECRSAETFERRALELLGRTVGFDAAFFLVKGDEPAATILGLDASTAARARARGGVYAEELLPVKRAALARRGVAVDTEVRGVAAVRKCRYYREIAATVRGEHALMAYVPWGGSFVAALMLGRGGRGFSAREIALVESALPALGVARAAFGLSWRPEPLLPSPSTLLGRLGFDAGVRVLETARTGWGTVVVRDRAGFREMVACQGPDELVWSRVSLSDSRRSGWPYVELFHLAPALAGGRRRALCVGAGGAVGVRQLASTYPGIAVDLVEREPVVVDLARRWFDLDGIPGVTVHVADGVAFIRDAAPGSWDVVVLDAYDAERFPEELTGPPFLRAVRRALRDDGVLACNLIGTLLPGDVVSTFVASARGVFGSVRVVPVVAPDEDFSRDALRNVVVLVHR